MRDLAFQHEIGFAVMLQRRVLFKVTAVINKLELSHLPLVIRATPGYAIVVGNKVGRRPASVLRVMMAASRLHIR